MPVSYTTTQANASIANLMKNIRSYNTNNSNVIVYKNVNLSNCKSKTDVLNKLKKSGYKISSSNLNYIMNLIRNYQAANGGSNSTTPTQAPTPTKAPVITATPAPMKVPTQAPTKVPTPAPTKAPAPTATPAPSNNTGLSSYASQVLQLVNQERAKAGLPAYTTNSAITAAANLRAKEIVQSFSHTRPNGTSCFTALDQYNVSYRTAGENIAYGQRTPQEVVTAWMNSPGHRANILNGNFGKIGIGVYQVNGTYYWSQEFTN
jgi:uncharacterized protein YkwD